MDNSSECGCFDEEQHGLDVLVVLSGRYEVWDLWFDRELERKIMQSFAL